MKSSSNCLGNDIIDLTTFPFEKYTSPRYCKKVMTTREMALIETSSQGVLLSAVFFACKESAYKHFVKKGRLKAFCPHAFEVHITKASSCSFGNTFFFQGTTHCDAGQCKFSCELHPGSFVHAISHGEVDGLAWKTWIDTLPPNSVTSPSELIRSGFITYLYNKACLSDNIQFASDASTLVPRLFLNGVDQRIDLSISHDGSYLACTYTTAEL